MKIKCSSLNSKCKIYRIRNSRYKFWCQKYMMQNVYATRFLLLIDCTLPSLKHVKYEIIHYMHYILSRISISKQALFYLCMFILIYPTLIGTDSYWAHIANYFLVSSVIKNNAMNVKPSASSFLTDSASKFHKHSHCNHMLYNKAFHVPQRCLSNNL